MRRTLLALTAALALLGPTTLAVAASLPQAANPRISVPNSLGGLRVGQAEAQAKVAWGSGRGKCEKRAGGFGFCEYGSSVGSAGSARIEFRNGKVAGASIRAGVDAKGSQSVSAARALMEFKTSGGIGIGSPFNKLKAAYPKGEMVGKPSEGSFFYVFETPGGHFMSFSMLGTSKRIYQIGLSFSREA